VTTKGRFINQGKPSENRVEAGGKSTSSPSAPPIQVETPAEKGFLEKGADLLAKGDIPILQEAQKGIQSGIDGSVEYLGYHPAAMAAGAALTAVNVVFFPTNVVDFTPGKLLKIGKKGVDAVRSAAKDLKQEAKVVKAESPKPETSSPATKEKEKENVQVRGEKKKDNTKKNEQLCKSLRSRIENTTKQLTKKRAPEIESNTKLPFYDPYRLKPHAQDVLGHMLKFRVMQNDLKGLIKRYKAANCGPLPPGADEAASMPLPRAPTVAPRPATVKPKLPK
jgi:hypothetical protein